MLKQLLFIIAFLSLCLSAKAQSPSEILLKISKESVEKYNKQQQIDFRNVEPKIDSFHQFDFVDENWNDTPFGRAIYSYDGNDNNHFTQYYELDTMVNSYNLAQIIDQVFTGSLIDSTYIRTWDEASGTFVTQIIQANTYNADDLLETQWLMFDVGFFVLFAQSYYYYSSENVLDSLTQDISFDNVTFEPGALVVFDYDAEGNMETSLTTAYNDAGQIENSARDSSVYDTYNRRTDYFSWEWDLDNSLWIPEQSVNYDNDEYGTPLIEYQKLYDMAVGSFSNELKTQYFFGYLSSIDETKFIECAMLNPSNGIIQMNCPDLVEHENVLLQVYDLTGRLVITKAIDQNENISFHSGLESGTYIVFLSSNNYPLMSDKLIIR